MQSMQQQVMHMQDTTGVQGHLNILEDKLEKCRTEVQDSEAEIQRLMDQMKKLEEKIEETSKGRNVLEQPHGTKFEFQVLQIIIPAVFIEQDLEVGYDPATLKLLYSVSDSEQGQFFATKGAQTARVEQNGLRFYRAIFNEKFTFTLSEDNATDVLNVKVFTTISTSSANSSAEQQASPQRKGGPSAEDETSERMLECLKFRLRDSLIQFQNQQEVQQEMKQTKCKMAFKGRWLHNKDELRYENLRKDYKRKYLQTQEKKRKLEKAEDMLAKAHHQTQMQQSSAVIKHQSAEVFMPESGETMSIPAPMMIKSNSVAGSGLSLSANKKSSSAFRGAFGRASLKPIRAGFTAQDVIPEEGQNTDGKVDPFTTANLQKYSATMPKTMNTFGVKSFARTEKHSMKSYMSSLSSMSNFFRVTDSPFGGVIPSAVLRQAMDKRQEQREREGAQADQPNETSQPGANHPSATAQQQQDLVNTSADQQGSAGDTTQMTINQNKQAKKTTAKGQRFGGGNNAKKGQGSFRTFIPRSVANLPLNNPFLVEAMRESEAKDLTSAQIHDRYQKVSSARRPKNQAVEPEEEKE